MARPLRIAYILALSITLLHRETNVKPYLGISAIEKRFFRIRLENKLNLWRV
jgi:hypothetical protein